jgi:TPR repeat protein
LLLLIKKGRKAFLWAGAISFTLITILFLLVYAPAIVWKYKANRGDAAAMYELARWTESHDEQVGNFILWPFEPDVYGGFTWLEKSASLDYPPAVYALGVRLKQGLFVPRPVNWTGPAGNVFPQPERGQEFIDKALRLGYHPTIEEQYFYNQEYRK